VDNPYARRNISYKELDYLSSMGADVYHKDAIYPVMESNIPIHIRNTNDIHSKGTMIHDNYEYDKAYDIVGIVGRPGYCFFKPNNIYNKLNKKGMFITEKFTAILAENINNDQYENEYCVTLENCIGCNSLLLLVINPTADKSIVYDNIEIKLKEYNESYIMSFADTDNQLLYIGINERIREMLIKEIYYMYYS